MKGSVLKEFLVTCEALGILHLKVDSSLSSLDDELEVVWKGLSCPDVSVAECNSSSDSASEHQQLHGQESPSLTKLGNCSESKASNVITEPPISPSGIGVDSASKSPNNLCYRISGNCFEQDIMAISSSVQSVNDETEPNCGSIPIDSHETKDALNDNPTCTPVYVSTCTPADCTNYSIPSDLLEISTPNLSVMHLNKLQKISPLPQPSFCSTPTVRAADTSSVAVRNQGSVISGGDSSTEFNLPHIEVTTSTESESNSCFVTSASLHSTGSHECQLTEMQESSEVDSNDDDDDDDDSDSKLEQLFAKMKLQTDVKKITSKNSFRKSLGEFIVSDSEEVIIISDGEDVATPTDSPLRAKSYHTPCTPATGLIFWGSPKKNSFCGPGGKAFTCVKERVPLVETHNCFTPLIVKQRPVQPLTTPSAHKHFPRFKKKMLSELFDLFNRTVFDGKLSGVELIWNNKLRTSAGYCRYRGLSNTRVAIIEISNKVCDSFDRLRDTLVHEMCHAACWVIDGTKTAQHGPVWKAWADKAMAKHPGLQPITRCHDYVISFKYTYNCTRCDFKLGRHSKSVNLKTARCPYCESKLELEPRLKSDGTPFAPRKLSRYAQFLKDNYDTVKKSSSYLTHSEIVAKVKVLYHETREEDKK